MQMKHLCFTYFIVPIEEHLFKKPASREEQQEWLREALFLNKQYLTSGGAEYAVRITSKKQLSLAGDSGLIFGKLSRKKHFHKHEITPDDIEEKNVDDWPYVGFLCDMRKGNQKFIVEFDKRVIDRVSSFKRNIQEIANREMFSHGYSVAFELIVRKMAFWNIVKAAHGIYKLRFSLNSPNLFSAGEEAEKALKDCQRVFNNNRAEIEIINDDGKLKMPEANLRAFQEYADNGGGSWKIVVQKNSRKISHNSSEKADIISIEADERANPEVLRRVLDRVLARNDEDK